MKPTSKHTLLAASLLVLAVLSGVVGLSWHQTHLLARGGAGLSMALLIAVFELARHEYRLRERTQDELDRFFILAPDMLCLATTGGYFKRLNPTFTATLGWSLEELLARPFLDFVHPDDQAATRRELEKLAAGENVFSFVNRYQCKDGSWRWLSWKCTPQPDGMIYATVRDFTALKQAEEALRRSEESLYVTLASIGDAVLATNPEGRVALVNPVAEKLLVCWARNRYT